MIANKVCKVGDFFKDNDNTITMLSLTEFNAKYGIDFDNDQ